MDYEEIHEWVEMLEDALRELAHEERQHFDARGVPHVCSIINDLMSGSSAYGDGLPRMLSVSPALVRKFQKFSGTITLQDARILVDRLRSYIKSMDQVYENPKIEKELFVQPVEAKVSFPAIEWRNVPRISDVKQQITEVSRILDNIIAGITRSTIPLTINI